MKAILFFDRCELTKLYGSISKNLNNDFNIIHVAYSSSEEDELKRMGIKADYNYSNLLEEKLKMFKVTDDLIKGLDSFIIKASNGRFNLNQSIQSDRGFSCLSYEEAIMLSLCHFSVWHDIFKNLSVTIMYHESCSQFLVFIGALMCKSQGGIYRDMCQCISDKHGYRYINIDGENFDCSEINRNFNFFKENPDLVDIKRCQKFLNDFRESYEVFMETEFKNNLNIFNLYIHSILKRLSKIKNRSKYDKLLNNIDYWLLRNNLAQTKINNLRDYKKRNIVFETHIPENEKYYYYSFHLEPESTVLYLGDGLYENQVKLIQNIAASLPAGCYLYVKDHPHELAYRDAIDYERLNKIPNVRLFNPNISGKLLISKAKGVFSINGTACLEALFLGKQVYCFGNSYYAVSPRVNVIKHVKDIRSIVYNNVNKRYSDDISFYAFVESFLKSSHNGFVNYFGGRDKKLGIDNDTNAKLIAQDIISEFSQNDTTCSEILN